MYDQQLTVSDIGEAVGHLNDRIHTLSSSAYSEIIESKDRLAILESRTDELCFMIQKMQEIIDDLQGRMDSANTTDTVMDWFHVINTQERKNA